MNQWLFVLYVGYAEYSSIMASVHYMTDKIPKCLYRGAHAVYDRGYTRQALYKSFTGKLQRKQDILEIHTKHMKIHNSFQLTDKVHCYQTEVKCILCCALLICIFA